MQDRDDDDIADLLPLKTAWLYILLALADGTHHGYGIRAHVEEQTQGRVKLWPATLYGSIRELSEEGLIEELEDDAAEVEDARRRCYALTSFGKRVLAAEVDRLQALVDAARATRALEGA